MVDERLHREIRKEKHCIGQIPRETETKTSQGRLKFCGHVFKDRHLQRQVFKKLGPAPQLRLRKADVRRSLIYMSWRPQRTELCGCREYPTNLMFDDVEACDLPTHRPNPDQSGTDVSI